MYPLENMNNNGIIKKAIWSIFGCSILGHSITAPSSDKCLHRCEMCKEEESWCGMMKTIRISDGYEENVCISCGRKECISNGNLYLKD